MGSYRDDSDRFHSLLDQHKRDCEARELERDVLDLGGVDGERFDKMDRTFRRCRKLFDLVGLPAATQCDIEVRAMMRVAGIALDDVAVTRVVTRIHRDCFPSLAAR
jgi:hypothetical protein